MIEEQKAVYQALLDAQASGQTAALVTVIHTQGSIPRHAGSKMLVHGDGAIVGTVGGGAMESEVAKEALTALLDGQTRLKTYTLNSIADGDPGICGGTVQLFIEPIFPAPTLLIIGGGHVGKALAELGLWMGFRVVLSDDRAEFCNPEYIPNLQQYIVCQPSEVGQYISITAQTFVAALTRGMLVDLDLIPMLLNTSAPYIGLIGSRRRWLLTAKALQEQRGLTEAQLARVRAPIGLEINAETPKEIAVSILSEMIMLRRGGTGQPMRLTELT